MAVPLSRSLKTLRHPRGASAVEYLVALLLTGLVVMGVTRLFGEVVREKFSDGDEKISNLDHEQGSSNQGSSITASADGEGGQGRAGAGSRGSHVTGAGGRLGADSELGGGREVSQEEAQRIALMKERGYSVKQEKSDYERRFGSDTEKGPRHVDATKTYYLPGEKPDMEAGINPFILFLIGLIVAGLIFFIFKNQSAGGGD